MSLDSPSDNAMTALYRVALGPVNTDHYLPIFARFDTTGRATTTWNWAASVCTLNWMVFRQVWSGALAYVAAAEGLALLVFALGRQFLNWPQGVELGVLAAFALLAFAVPGLYGNAILHADIRRRIARALAASRTVPEACALLEQKASTRKRLQAIVGANVALAVVAVGAYLAVPRAGFQGPAEASMAPAVTVAEAASAAAAAAAAAASASPPAATPSAPEESQAATPSTPAPASAPAPAPASTPVSESPSAPATPTVASKAAPAPPTAIAAQAPAPAPAARASAAPPPPAQSSRTASNTAAKSDAPAAAPARPAAATAPATALASKPDAAPRAPAAKAAAGSKPAASERAAARTPPAAGSRASAATAAGAASPAAASASDAASAPLPVVGSAPGYYINVGLFADEANARKAQARLLNEGLPAFRQELNNAKGRRIRVRVGPYPSRAQADAAAEGIRAMALEAVVFKQ